MGAIAIKELIAFPLFKLIGYRPQRATAETFDREWTGNWASLGDLNNLGGLTSVFGYCQYFSPDTILDVGCGDGLLAKKLKVLPYRSYVGIDVSSVALAKAQALRDARTQFIACDAQSFDTDVRFDAIIFSQCLYYMPDPVETIRRYGRLLSAGGRMIVALHHCARSHAVWSLLRDHVDVEDSMTVIQSTGRTTTKVLRPR